MNIQDMKQDDVLDAILVTINEKESDMDIGEKLSDANCLLLHEVHRVDPEQDLDGYDITFRQPKLNNIPSWAYASIACEGFVIVIFGQYLAIMDELTQLLDRT